MSVIQRVWTELARAGISLTQIQRHLTSRDSVVFGRRLRASIAPIPAALALLPRIRSGVTAGVLTNNNLLVLRHFRALYPAIATRVGTRACVSAEFGVRKPHPDAYRGCLGRLGAAPAATLFIDDSEANVAGAVAAGLAAHRTSGAEDLEAALQRFGLLA